MGQGATMALPIWAYFMKKVFADPNLPYDPSIGFDLPDNFDPCYSTDTEYDSSIEEVYE